MTAHAAIAPLGQVYAAGRAYQNATSRRPRFIVVLGMWLIFGPQTLILGIGLIAWVWKLLTLTMPLPLPRHGLVTVEQLTGGSATSTHWPWTVVRMVVSVGVFLLYTLILWKVTAKYLAPPTNESA